MGSTTINLQHNVSGTVTDLHASDGSGNDLGYFNLYPAPVNANNTLGGPLDGTLTIIGNTNTSVVQSTSNPSFYGQSVTISATVTSSNGTPTGTVTFEDNGTSIGTGSVSSSGLATYTPSAIQLPTGTDTITAIYGSDTNFNGSTSTDFTQTVNKATPTITWSPAAITYGTTVAGSESGDTESWVVNGSTVTVAGTSSYSPAGTTLPSAGTTSLSLTFTPTDTTDYTTAATTVSLTVNKATPTITWATPSAITYGTTVAGSESGDTESWVVNGSTVTVAGTSSYSPAGTTLPSAGTTLLSLTFTPTDTTDYTTAATTVSLTVNKATPTITWSPAAITYGTTVAGSESGDTESWVVNGSTVTVAGTSSYSPAGTTLPSAGTTSLSLTFTPTDTTDYTTAATTVSLTVNKATPTIMWLAGSHHLWHHRGRLGERRYGELGRERVHRDRGRHFLLQSGRNYSAVGWDDVAVSDVYADGHDRLHDGSDHGLPDRQQGDADDHVGDAGSHHLWHHRGGFGERRYGELGRERVHRDGDRHFLLQSGRNYSAVGWDDVAVSDVYADRHDRLHDGSDHGLPDRQQGDAGDHVGYAGSHHLWHHRGGFGERRYGELGRERVHRDGGRHFLLQSGRNYSAVGWDDVAVADVYADRHDRLHDGSDHGLPDRQQGDAGDHVGAGSHHLWHHRGGFGERRYGELGRERVHRDGGRHFLLQSGRNYSAVGWDDVAVADVYADRHDRLHDGSDHGLPDRQQGDAGDHVGRRQPSPMAPPWRVRRAAIRRAGS